MVPVHAESEPLDVSVVEQELDEEAREISGGLVTDGSYDLGGAIGRLIMKAKARTYSLVKEEGKELTGIAAIAVLCAAAESICTEARIREILSICACAAVSGMATASVGSLLGSLDAAISAMSAYARSTLPAVYTAAAVSGAVVSAGAKYGAVLLCLNIMLDLYYKLTLPLIHVYLAFCISRSIYPNAILSAAVSVTKWLAVSLMTVLTMGVSAYIGLTGALTGGADAVAVKGTKTVISTTLPVVGGILSDAASVVLASARTIKNAAGVFALIGVCALCLTPFLAAWIKMMLFRLCAAIAAAAEGKRLGVLLGDLSSAFGMMLGALGSMTIMLFISFMAAIRTVSG